jgi:para-aminobenzoate synthetase component 1
LLTEGFHITLFNGKKKHYHIINQESPMKLLVLPFEYYHSTLFKIENHRQPNYSLSQKNSFYLEESGSIEMDLKNDFPSPEVKCSLSKEEYIQSVEQIKKHIHRGDIYEMNFCFEFFAENAQINPFLIFEKLYKKTQAPFSSLTRIDDLYIICASPERFIKKTGEKIVSEPMKGTAPRNVDPKIDEENKFRLQNSEKEKNENVMIVDLVRNDLSKIAKRGSVEVESLFEVKSFATVHQMISTIKCNNNNHSLEEILQATFPMGSMTGAPKKRVLELTTQYEKSARGIYSGTIGIIQPNGDFDLAVIIRSIVYDAKKKYLSFSVGSAITAACNPEEEYEECLLKAKALIEVLKS